MQFLLYLATLNLIFICLVLHVLSTQFQNCCVHSFNSALSAQVEMETQCGCILLLCHLEWVIWFGCVHWSQRVNLVKSCSDSFQRHSFVWGWSEGWSAPRNLGWTYRSNQPTPRTAASLFFFWSWDENRMQQLESSPSASAHFFGLVVNPCSTAASRCICFAQVSLWIMTSSRYTAACWCSSPSDTRQNW